MSEVPPVVPCSALAVTFLHVPTFGRDCLTYGRDLLTCADSGRDLAVTVLHVPTSLEPPIRVCPTGSIEAS